MLARLAARADHFWPGVGIGIILGFALFPWVVSFVTAIVAAVEASHERKQRRKG